MLQCLSNQLLMAVLLVSSNRASLFDVLRRAVQMQSAV